MDFVRCDVEDLTTVAHLFPRSSGRRGIYRLRFTDGTGYVGQSVDVVRRFGAHRARNPDLVALEFARASVRSNLDELEVSEIRAEEARGVRLRNVVHGTADALAETDLDTVVGPDEQRAWLAGEQLNDHPGRVAFEPARTARGKRQFQQLIDGPNGAWALAVSRAYVEVTVPRPRATEGSFWVATARPSTRATADQRRLVAISVNAMETLVLTEDPRDPGLIGGLLNVRRSTIVEQYGSLAAFRGTRTDWLDVVEAPYPTAAGDGLTLRFARTDFAERLFDEDSAGILQAAASLNLMLMRKGPSLQWRYHNVLLGRLLLAP